MLTRHLMNERKIRGVQGLTGEREWTFCAADINEDWKPQWSTSASLVQ